MCVVFGNPFSVLRVSHFLQERSGFIFPYSSSFVSLANVINFSAYLLGRRFGRLEVNPLERGIITIRGHKLHRPERLVERSISLLAAVPFFRLLLDVVLRSIIFYYKYEIIIYLGAVNSRKRAINIHVFGRSFSEWLAGKPAE